MYKQGGRIYEQYMMGIVMFDIKKHEVGGASELTQQVTSLEKDVESLKEDAFKKAESLKMLANEKQLLIQSSVVAASSPFNYGSASYVLLSFSFPSLCEDVLAGSGNHTFAAIRCVEKYDTLEAGLESVFTDIDELIQLKEIEVNETKIKLDIILGEDMKFMLILLGSNAAMAKYSCVWCHIHKKDR